MTEKNDEEVKIQPVDRARRYTLVKGIVMYCLVIATFITILVEIGLLSGQALLAKTLVDGLITLAIATTLSYLGASSIDYNGGIANMFSKNDSYSRTNQNNRYG